MTIAALFSNAVANIVFVVFVWLLCIFVLERSGVPSPFNWFFRIVLSVGAIYWILQIAGAV